MQLTKSSMLLTGTRITRRYPRITFQRAKTKLKVHAVNYRYNPRVAQKLKLFFVNKFGTLSEKNIGEVCMTVQGLKRTT